ncbi:MAG: Uncharacterised protein [Flavobacteriia bacterium]|nr:MAG: Uncharacterised protein [Flavobacteriia bacterium]
MRQAFLNGLFAPAQIDRALLFLLLNALGKFKKSLGGIVSAVQKNVFHIGHQLLVHLFVHLKQRWIHNAHVHTVLDTVVQKRRVHGLTDPIVPAKTEGNIGNPTAHTRMRQMLLDPLGGTKEIDRISAVFFHARAHGKNIRVEDDVLRRHAHFLGEDGIGAFADLDPPLVAVGLSVFIECHDDDRRSVVAHLGRLFDKSFFTFLQAQAVHHALSLQALQPGLNDLPLGRIHHNGNSCDVRLGHDQIQEGFHGFHSIDHAFVHIDVEDLSTVFHLILCDLKGRIVVALVDQSQELSRSGHIAALANIHEVRSGRDRQRFESAQAKGLHFRHGIRDF